jgi:hypothetical protein
VQLEDDNELTGKKQYMSSDSSADKEDQLENYPYVPQRIPWKTRIGGRQSL